MNYVNFGSRYYDPVTGVFMAVDPQDVFFNTYSYVGGNPVMLTDPDGENPFIEMLIGGVVGGIVGGATNFSDNKFASIVGGAILGGMAGAGIGAGVDAIGSGANSMATATIKGSLGSGLSTMLTTTYNAADIMLFNSWIRALGDNYLKRRIARTTYRSVVQATKQLNQGVSISKTSVRGGTRGDLLLAMQSKAKVIIIGQHGVDDGVDYGDGSSSYFIESGLPANTTARLIIMNVCQVPMAQYSGIHNFFPNADIVYTGDFSREGYITKGGASLAGSIIPFLKGKEASAPITGINQRNYDKEKFFLQFILDAFK